MRITGFGEILLRLTPVQAHDRLLQTPALSVGYAGAESNVLCNLAHWGHEAAFVSRLPEHDWGTGALRFLQTQGVDTRGIQRGGDRIGTYYIEQGISVRPSRIVYDRRYSAMEQLDADAFNWQEILKSSAVLHLSGITPALSEACSRACIAAAETAREMGVVVSFDMNFRRSLWQGRDPRPVFDRLLSLAGIVFGNVGAFVDVYGLTLKPADAAAQCFEQLRQISPADLVAFTSREATTASHQQLGGMLWQNGRYFSGKSYNIDVIERIGSGDAFASALLHGWASGWSPQRSIDFATAAFALKHTIPGDLQLAGIAEVAHLDREGGSGFVLR